MRRLTVALDDDLFGELINYAADRSKRNVRRISLGESVRLLLSVQLAQVGHRHEGSEDVQDQPLELATRIRT